METNSKDELLELIKQCSIEQFVDVIKNVMIELKCYCSDFDYSFDSENGIVGTITRLSDNQKCILIARQYDMLAVDVNEIRKLINLMASLNCKFGLFITTSYFSREVQDYCSAPTENISLIDGKVLCRYLSSPGKSNLGIAETLNTNKADRQEVVSDSDSLRIRASKELLRVTFPDGKVFCDKSSTRTLMQTIEYIGIERVKDLGMEICHVPLISHEIVPKYKEWMRPLSNGWLLMTQSNTDQKCLQLISINNQLKLNLKIERGSSFENVTNIGLSSKKTKEQSFLLVTIADGTVIGGMNPVDTYIKTIEYLGIENVLRSNAMLSGKEIITKNKRYNGQRQLQTGEWLTIPGQTKDKYKALRVIAAMVHVKIEVTIV
jgi:hypothetical protein